MPLIEIKNIVKTYTTGEDSFNALNGVSFSVEKGEFVAIMGTSGSGKSTCMNTLGTLDRPTSGSYHLDGVDVFSLSPEELSKIRNKKLYEIVKEYDLDKIIFRWQENKTNVGSHLYNHRIYVPSRDIARWAGYDR